MTGYDQRGEAVRERLLPQASIRFFLLLIGICAVSMYTFRQAIVGDHTWAKIASLVIATFVVCFVVYALMFLMANLFTSTTAPLARSIASEQKTKLSDGDT